MADENIFHQLAAQDAGAKSTAATATTPTEQNIFHVLAANNADGTNPDIGTIGGQPVNLRTGIGASQAAQSQAATRLSRPILNEPPDISNVLEQPSSGGSLIPHDEIKRQAEAHHIRTARCYKTDARQSRSAR